MSYLTGHWSYDPFMIIVIILVVWHEIGLARLDRLARSRPARLAFPGGAGHRQGDLGALAPDAADGHRAAPAGHPGVDGLG